MTRRHRRTVTSRSAASFARAIFGPRSRPGGPDSVPLPAHPHQGRRLRDDAEEGPREAHEGLVDWAESVVGIGSQSSRRSLDSTWSRRISISRRWARSTRTARFGIEPPGSCRPPGAGTSPAERAPRFNLLARAADLIPKSPIVSPSSSISPRSSPEAATWGLDPDLRRSDPVGGCGGRPGELPVRDAVPHPHGGVPVRPSLDTARGSSRRSGPRSTSSRNR